MVVVRGGTLRSLSTHIHLVAPEIFVTDEWGCESTETCKFAAHTHALFSLSVRALCAPADICPDIGDLKQEMTVIPEWQSLSG